MPPPPGSSPPHDDGLVRRRHDRHLWITNPRPASFITWVIRYYVFTLLLAAVGIAAFVISLYRHYAAELPSFNDIERYDSLAPGVTRIYANDGTLLSELAREHRSYAKYEQIPQHLAHAFLAAEDRRFFEHGGLDYRGLGRAILTNLRTGTIAQGGSTITQQVAKGFLSHERTLARKLREAILSVRMESRLPKEDILEIYLNKIFLGHNAYGVAAAASRYFDKKLSELTLAEAALIAGLARAPSRYSPVAYPERALERRAVVLHDMVEAGYITAQERDEANQEPIVLAEAPDVFRHRAPHYAEHVRQLVTERLGEEAVLQAGLRIETAISLPVQALAEAAVDEAVRDLDRRQGWRGPVAHLSDENAQNTLRQRLERTYGDAPLREPERWRLALVESVERTGAIVNLGATQASLPLRALDWASSYQASSGINDVKISDARVALEPGDVVWVRRGKRTGQDNGLPVVELGQVPRIEAALYTVDHQTGYVEAMQGGHDYDRSQFNRPTQACRQPGSVFKAIYYALALDSGRWTMSSVLEDRAYEPEPGEEWNPQNIHGTLEGQVLLRNAFIHSLNLPSIRLFLRLGAPDVVQWARQLGITSELIADKALSLGASCVRTDELTRAFGIYVREGRWFDPIYVRRVIDKNGRVVLDERHPYDGTMDVAGRIDAIGRMVTDPPVQAIDRRTAFLITQMLRDVVTNGIGRRALRVGVPAGGKSGTASKNAYTTDTWFVGFTSRYVTSAWMGDDTYERSMGDEEASYTTATPLWTDYMEKVVENIPHGEIPVATPPGVRSQSVSYFGAGEQRSAVLYFLNETSAIP